MKSERVKALNNVDIYPVTCELLSNGRSDVEILEGIIEGGARIIQLRDKLSTKRQLFEKAKIFRKITREANIILIVNDHIDIAVAVNADGVHLGQEDFPVLEAKNLFPDLLIGVSTHSIEHALVAEQQGADYINIGPIYPTKTKTGNLNIVGTDLIELVSNKISIPFTVMGGINFTNIERVLKKGATRIAVVSAITQADDIAETVKKFRKAIQSQSQQQQ